jgi:hypothetical protein
MPTTIHIDMSQVERAAYDLHAAADQMPFIMSVALNKALVATREYLVSHTWPESIVQRNPGFIKAALRMEFSKKNDLRVEIYDRLERASLKKHAEGGVKLPRGRQLAIPTRYVKVGAHGVPRNKRPRNLPKDQTFVQNNRIYQTVGKGKNRKLQVMYVLKPQVKINKDVPFYSDFETQLNVHVMKELPQAITYAMSTRR